MKKIIMILMFFTITSLVADNRVFYEANLNNNNYFQVSELDKLKITFSFPDVRHEKDWLGVFKQGAERTNANLLAWNYVGLLNERPGRFFPLALLKEGQLVEGSYDLVYFRNDTYEQVGITGKLDLLDQSFARPFEDQVVEENPYAKIFSLALEPKEGKVPTDWIGLFKEGQTHNRANLLAWSYIDGFLQTELTKLSDIKLTVGTYEMVYFTEDSYLSYGQPSEYKVIESAGAIAPINSLDYRLDTDDYLDPETHELVEFEYGTLTVSIEDLSNLRIYQPKNWVGLFLDGKAYTRENLLAWVYVGHAKEATFNMRILNGNRRLLASGEYRGVYFLDDTYEPFGETETLIVE